ncbi:hypothetical protein ACSLO8_24440, partial [Escherichia coli]
MKSLILRVHICPEDDIPKYMYKDKSASSLITPPLSKSDALSNKVSNQSYSVEQIEVAEAAKR